jgi:ABC-type nitrate/sulfonate/bicarbonate transport system permease component
MFACLALLSVLGLSFHLIVRVASRMIVFWKPIEEEVIGA